MIGSAQTGQPGVPCCTWMCVPVPPAALLLAVGVVLTLGVVLAVFGRGGRVPGGEAGSMIRIRLPGRDPARRPVGRSRRAGGGSGRPGGGRGRPGGGVGRAGGGAYGAGGGTRPPGRCAPRPARERW
ncbi:conserved hypothetical protein [Frankia alni ACN14a]|uniref:Uncharacterized protein n=1 Tax=Frankia alni (strain DSM 45986 / CECT 9034 / ACN14a) TaxID=326424 RepID=Q0RSE0_FRAAA|nr:conserved hypothetical protein [Frankia alni ACN14a]